MLCLADIGELFALADDRYAVMVADVEPFERASLMLFNCGHPDNAMLTPDEIETAPGLHKIQWTQNIGLLPREWNHVVFYNEPCEAQVVHYTAGIPLFEEVKGCEYTDEWVADASEVMSSKSWRELMSNSVHVPKVVEFNKQRGK